MVDYEQMYYKMDRAMDKAINTLIEAQRECEEDYLTQTDPPKGKDDKENSEQ